MLNLVAQGLIGVVNRHNTEVVLEVYYQEAHGHVLLLWEVVHDLRTEDDALVLSSL